MCNIYHCKYYNYSGIYNNNNNNKETMTSKANGNLKHRTILKT